jgi:hypothetical protein
MRGWSGCSVVTLVVGLGLATCRPVTAAPFINILDDAVVLAPTPDDYTNDYVEATGAAGLGVKVKNTSSTGLTLLVRSATASPGIAVGDLLVRTLTPPGTGGVSLTTYTVLGATNLNLWSTGVPQGPFMQVDMDIRIRNLFNYDADGTYGTSYTNTLIFTVIEP